MAPISIDIKTDNSNNSVSNSLNNWTRLVEKDKNKDFITREVLMEKLKPQSTYLEDITYLQHKMLAALKVPKQYFKLDNDDSLTREVLFEKNDKFSNLKNIRKNTIKHWENSGFLDGLQGHMKSNIFDLYQSQASHLLNDIQAQDRITYNIPVGISSRGVGERIKTAINYQRPNWVHAEKETVFEKIKSFFTSIWRKIFKKKSKSNFDNLAFPIVQRVAFRTMANDLVSVQPLSAPTGMLFYFDNKYEAENVYSRVVIVEKYEKYVRYNSIHTEQDIYISQRHYNQDIQLDVDINNR